MVNERVKGVKEDFYIFLRAHYYFLLLALRSYLHFLYCGGDLVIIRLTFLCITIKATTVVFLRVQNDTCSPAQPRYRNPVAPKIPTYFVRHR